MSRLVISQSQVGLEALLTDPLGLRVRNLPAGLRYDLFDPKTRQETRQDHLSPPILYIIK